MKFFTRRRPESPNIVLYELKDGTTLPAVSHEQASLRSRIRPYVESFLPKLRLPVSTLIGANITAFTTFALVRHVQHKIATAKVSSEPKKWMQVARTKAYDACYHGCNDCGDTNFAYKACEMTARARIPGVICDGNLMWNWAGRYPIDCLKAVGEFYKADALRKLKQSYRNQLALIILTVLAGVVGAVVTYKLWNCVSARSQARARSRPSGDPPRNQAVGVGSSPRPPPLPAVHPKMRGGGRSPGRIALLITAFASIIGHSRAYPCTGYDPKADQYFINPNQTLYGVVHGWFSNCYDYTCACVTTCTPTGGGPDNGGMSSSCSTTCSTCTSSDVAPLDYVNATLGHVKACGFMLVDAVDGDVNLRVANPLIERDLRVKVSVNKFNLTDVTDPSIFCLHDFANP